jgi:y4mF family transcriptional regulator
LKKLTPFAYYFKEKRHELGITQNDLSERAGVGLRFIRDVEQGKKTLRLDTVNQVLLLFGCEAAPVKILKKENNGTSG